MHLLLNVFDPCCFEKEISKCSRTVPSYSGTKYRFNPILTKLGTYFNITFGGESGYYMLSKIFKNGVQYDRKINNYYGQFIYIIRGFI